MTKKEINFIKTKIEMYYGWAKESRKEKNIEEAKRCESSAAALETLLNQLGIS